MAVTVAVVMLVVMAVFVCTCMRASAVGRAGNLPSCIPMRLQSSMESKLIAIMGGIPPRLCWLAGCCGELNEKPPQVWLDASGMTGKDRLLSSAQDTGTVAAAEVEAGMVGAVPLETAAVGADVIPATPGVDPPCSPAVV